LDKFICVANTKSSGNARHRHGATPTTAMTHIAIQEAPEGKHIEWLERARTRRTGGRPKMPLASSLANCRAYRPAAVSP
jgi:hypothetical protein